MYIKRITENAKEHICTNSGRKRKNIHREAEEEGGYGTQSTNAHRISECQGYDAKHKSW